MRRVLTGVLLCVLVGSTAGRDLLADDSTVLSLDAAASEVGPDLISLQSSEGDATWSNPSDPAMSIQLRNAGYDQAFGGAIVFTAPVPGAAQAGTYGEGKPVGVQEGAWGDEFTGHVWYKPAKVASGTNPVLLQVVGVDEAGNTRASATWRVAGFQDQTSGYIPIPGFDAQPTFTADSLGDCWVHLAMVKRGLQVEFFKDKLSVGTATASYVVNDYGADIIALGVDYSSLSEPGSNATGIDPAVLDKPLGWLSGSLGSVEVYSRALTAAEIAAKYNEQSPRFAESLCTLEPPSGGPPLASAPAPLPGTPTGTSPPTQTPSSPSGPQGTTTQPSPTPSPSAGLSPPPAGPPKPPSTLDTSTAAVKGSGSSGTVTNTLTFTGDQGLATLADDAAKQEQLKKAILDSLNLPPGYSTDNIEIKVLSVAQDKKRRRLQASASVRVVVEYSLKTTPEVTVEVLTKAENNVYLFIRVQQPTIPWWSGPTATVCISDAEGTCNPSKPPITPPVVNQDCSANVCFLLDGSKSLINVDAWNDVVAAARSIIYSIADPAASYDVFWFSNDVVKIGHATGVEVAADNSFTQMILNTVPDARGTFMAQALQTCQNVLLDEDAETSRTVVLITDGKPTDPEATYAAADALKQYGIKLVVVGAGEIDYDTLKALASGPQFVFANTNLDSSQLMLMADLASEGVCRELD